MRTTPSPSSKSQPSSPGNGCSGRQRKSKNSFIEFLLAAILAALLEASSEQVGAPVSEQVAAILRACAGEPRSKADLLQAAGLANAYLNYKRHIQPLLADGLLQMTNPDKPNSRLQKYRLTEKGRFLLA